MVEYRLLDAEFVLPVCLHGGPIDLSSMHQYHAETPYERQFSLPSGSHASVLAKLGEMYGATGIAAIDGEKIVGLIRFCPRAVEELMAWCLCPQEEGGA